MTMINAAIVGLGWWGRTLVESAQGSDFIRFVAGATRTVSPEVKAFADTHKLRLAENFEALLTDPNVQAVVLCTPHSMHARQVIAAAQAQNLPRSEFRLGDALTDPSMLRTTEADFICFSGSLNTMDEPCARRLVQLAFEAAARGVVFNFLSDRPHQRWADQPLAPARRFDTLAWVNWSLDLTSRVTFTQDYLDGHDATIMLRHD